MTSFLRTPFPLVLGALAFAVAVGIGTFRSSPEPAALPETPAAPLEAASASPDLSPVLGELRGLAQAFGGLRDEVAKLHERVAAVELAAAESPAIAVQPEPSQGEDATGSGDGESAWVTVTHALSSSFRAEDYDPAWSGQTEAMISGAFNELELDGSNLLRSECHETLCELVVSHDAPGRTAELEALVDRVNLSFVLEPDASGLETSIYFIREGSEDLLQDLLAAPE